MTKKEAMPVRAFEVIDAEMVALKASIADQQAKLNALYIEGLAALGEPYTEEMRAEWECIILPTMEESPIYMAFLNLMVLDSAYDFAKGVASGEIDDFTDGDD
jgi:hypothetical protein